MQRKHLDGEDPFWSLVELVKADNSIETLKKAMERTEGNEDTEGDDYIDEEEVRAAKQVQEDAQVDSDEEDLEKFYFYDCVFCKAIFRQKDDLVEHIKNCNKR